MIDPTGDELAEHEAGQHGQRDRRTDGARAKNHPRGPADRAQQSQLQRQRENDPGETLAGFARREGLKQFHQQGQRHVDHPRPVHERTRARIDPPRR